MWSGESHRSGQEKVTGEIKSQVWSGESKSQVWSGESHRCGQEKVAGVVIFGQRHGID